MEERKEKQNARRGRGSSISRNGRVGRVISSGGVIFKKTPDNILWLTTASSPSPEYPKVVWRLPKGRLDDEEDNMPGPLARGERKATEEEIQNAALKEIREEAGVKVKIVKKIGTERYFYTSKTEGSILKFVTFYLTEWESDLPEGFGYETSETKWLPFPEARKLLTHSGEKKILDSAKEILEQGLQENLI